MVKSHVRTTTKIITCLNSTPVQIEEFVKSESLDFKLIVDINNTFAPNVKKTIFGFTSFENMLIFLPTLKRPPILWESMENINHITRNLDIVCIDAKIHTSGLILFKKLNKKRLSRLIKMRFKNKQNLILETRSNMFGNNSDFSIALNSFLQSIPDYVHSPFLISLVSAIEEQNYPALDKFIELNRLLTDKNKKQFKTFNKEITKINPLIIHMLNKKTKKLRKEGPELKESLKRIRFLLSHFGTKDLTPYIDDEDNINMCNITI